MTDQKSFMTEAGNWRTVHKNMVHKVIYLKDGLVKTEYENEVRVPARELEDL